MDALPSDGSSLVADFPDLTELQKSLVKLLWTASFLNDITNAASQEELLVSGTCCLTLSLALLVRSIVVISRGHFLVASRPNYF